MKKVAIKGDGTEATGRKIIEYLKGLGGVNEIEANGHSKAYYLINVNGCIDCAFQLPDTHTLITLPNDEFKFGDKVVTKEGVKHTYLGKVDGNYLCTFAPINEMNPNCEYVSLLVLLDTVYPVPKMQITIDGKNYTKEEAIELLTK